MLNKILTAEPFKFFINVRKEFINLTFINFNFLNPVNQFIQLFLEEFFSPGEHLILKRFTRYFLQHLDIIRYTGKKNGD